jgi:sec-independent protein translocase protein TatC
VAFGLGGLAALPIWIYQAWRFIGRALHLKERSLMVGVFPAALALFFAGTAIAVFVVVPAAMKFLLGYSSPTLQPMISLTEYIAFLFWMIVGFGIFFQLPLVIVTLARFGVVDPKTLSRYRKHAVVAIFVAAAGLTPGPDIVSQLVLAVPSYLLFEISLIIARRVYKKEE